MWPRLFWTVLLKGGGVKIRYPRNKIPHRKCFEGVRYCGGGGYSGGTVFRIPDFPQSFAIQKKSDVTSVDVHATKSVPQVVSSGPNRQKITRNLMFLVKKSCICLISGAPRTRYFFLIPPSHAGFEIAYPLIFLGGMLFRGYFFLKKGYITRGVSYFGGILFCTPLKVPYTLKP